MNTYVRFCKAGQIGRVFKEKWVNFQKWPVILGADSYRVDSAWGFLLCVENFPKSFVQLEFVT